jgi:hypothetical protein
VLPDDTVLDRPVSASRSVGAAAAAALSIETEPLAQTWKLLAAMTGLLGALVVATKL